MIEILILSILAVIATALGNRILSWFSYQFDCFMEEQLTALGLGFGGLILMTFLLSALHILNPVSIAGILIISLIIGKKAFINAISRAITGIKPTRFQFTTFQIGCIIILSIMGLFNLLGALAPTTDTDGLAYHLAVPKYYLVHGGFTYNPIMVFNWPLTVEMLYTIAIALSSDSLAKLIHLMFGIMSALAVYLFTKEWFGKQAGIMATILFYAMPLVGLESGIAYVDLGTTFYTILGMLFFMRWYFSDANTLLLSSIFIGIASSTKWNGPITIIILLIFCIHKLFFQKIGSPSCHTILLFLIIASSFSLLWYAKNYSLTGNPVAPFLGETFETRDWTHSNSQAYQASVGSLYISPLHFILIPFALTTRGNLFGELTYIGSWFLMLLPLLIFSRPWPKAMKFIFIFSLLTYLAWFLTSQQSRLLLPTLALFCASCGWITEHERLKHLHLVIYTFLFVSILLSLPFTILYNGKGSMAVLGLESRQQYLERLLPNAETIQYVNDHVPPGSKILLIRENHGFLLNHAYVWGDAAMQGVLDLKQQDPAILLDNIKKLGITHIIVNRAISCQDPQDEERHCPDIQALLHSPQTKDSVNFMFEKNKVTLYQVT